MVILVANELFIVEKENAQSLILRELFFNMNFVVWFMFNIGAYDETKNEFYSLYALKVIFQLKMK